MAREMKDSGIEWIGEIPAEWNCRKCKTILSANDGGVWGNDPVGDDSDKVVIRSTEQTVDGKWCIDDPAKRDLSAVDHSRFRILKNDLLITKSSGSDLHIGKTTIADTYFDNHECYYSNFIQRIRCNGFNPRLLWYLFNSSIVREQCVYLQNSTSGIGNINSDIINNLFIPFPPLIEQQRVVSFLDRKCAEIDGVIAETAKTIEEYKALKQSIITEAVTKGIRPNRPMKDSGVEWIGTIPENWKKLKLKYCTYVRARLGWKGLKAEEYVEEGYPLLSAFNIINSKLDFTSVNYINQERYDESPEIMLALQDILLVKDGAGIGKCAIVESLPIPSTTNGSLAVITVTDLLLPKFLYYYFLSRMFQKFIDRLKDGMGVPHLFQADLREIEVVYGNVDEQKSIVDYLDERCTEIDHLIDEKHKLLVELETYKKSVIFEYVTGKKEVLI